MKWNSNYLKYINLSQLQLISIMLNKFHPHVRQSVPTVGRRMLHGIARHVDVGNFLGVHQHL